MIKKNLLCTICARGGSKGVPNKNIRTLVDRPLIAHTILQAKNTGLFENIVISSDSEKILSVAKEYGADVFFKRPDELASDNAGKLDVIRHAFLESENHYGKKYDYLIDLDATSPLRYSDDIINAYNQFIENDNDILITGAHARRSPYFNLVELTDQNTVLLSKSLDKKVVRRQDSPRCYDMNASIYIWKREAILKCETLFSDNTGIYVMPEERSQDIDSELDFKIVEMILDERKNAKR